MRQAQVLLRSDLLNFLLLKKAQLHLLKVFIVNVTDGDVKIIDIAVVVVVVIGQIKVSLIVGYLDFESKIINLVEVITTTIVEAITVINVINAVIVNEVANNKTIDYFDYSMSFVQVSMINYSNYHYLPHYYYYYFNIYSEEVTNCCY